MLPKKTTAVNKLRELKQRIKVIRGGTSAGKTIGILLILINDAIKNKGKEISVVASTIPSLRRGSLKDFLSIMQGLGRFDESKFNRSLLKYTFSNGSYIEFFSTDMPEKLKGARRTDLFMNECNNCSFSSYQELSIRTSGDIWLDYNPVNRFWVDKELIGQPDTDYITLTYRDNNNLSDSIIKELEKARLKAKTSTYWKNWCRVYLDGLTGSLEGACISDWKEIDNIPVEAKLLSYGMDFGYSVDPTTLIALYKWNDAYIFDEVLYKRGMLNRDISRYLNQHNIKENIIADSAEPKTISELKSYGFNIRGAKKGADSIKHGIQLLQEYDMLVTSGSLNLIKELRNYQWNDKKSNVPIDNHNHLIDGMRYLAQQKLGNKNTNSGSHSASIW